MNNHDNRDAEVRYTFKKQWLEEIERRLAELDSGTAKTVPWPTVQAELLRRVDKSITD